MRLPLLHFLLAWSKTQHRRRFAKIFSGVGSGKPNRWALQAALHTVTRLLKQACNSSVEGCWCVQPVFRCVSAIWLSCSWISGRSDPGERRHLWWNAPLVDSGHHIPPNVTKQLSTWHRTASTTVWRRLKLRTSRAKLNIHSLEASPWLFRWLLWTPQIWAKWWPQFTKIWEFVPKKFWGRKGDHAKDQTHSHRA